MPYSSAKQERFFNANRGGAIPGDVVDEWNKKSKGLKLPEQVKDGKPVRGAKKKEDLNMGKRKHGAMGGQGMGINHGDAGFDLGGGAARGAGAGQLPSAGRSMTMPAGYGTHQQTNSAGRYHQGAKTHGDGGFDLGGGAARGASVGQLPSTGGAHTATPGGYGTHQQTNAAGRYHQSGAKAHGCAGITHDDVHMIATPHGMGMAHGHSEPDGDEGVPASISADGDGDEIPTHSGRA